MDVTEKALQERYASQDTDELLELIAGGNLTEEALRIAEAELRKRGYDPPAQSVVSDKVIQSTKTSTNAQKAKWVLFVVLFALFHRPIFDAISAVLGFLTH